MSISSIIIPTTITMARCDRHAPMCIELMATSLIYLVVCCLQRQCRSLQTEWQTALPWDRIILL